MKNKNNIKQTAGRKGGLATLARHGPDHMRRIGQRGAVATWTRYYLAPVNESQYAMVDRKTNTIKAIR
jgi:general stress protein YciG